MSVTGCVALSKFILTKPACSELGMSLINVSLQFKKLISQICQYFLLKKIWEASLTFWKKKNISLFCYKVFKHLTIWSLNELVKLLMLWTTGLRSTVTVGMFCILPSSYQSIPHMKLSPFFSSPGPKDHSELLPYQCVRHASCIVHAGPRSAIGRAPDS